MRASSSDISSTGRSHPARAGAIQRLLVRRRAAPRPDSADGQREPGPAADDISTDDLIARVDDGIYVGDKSWSIDMQRCNFQFTGQRFFRIRNGRLDASSATSPTRPPPPISGTRWKWSGAVDLAPRGRVQLRQGPACQVAAVSHGCPSALFRGINVLNTADEGGHQPVLASIPFS